MPQLDWFTESHEAASSLSGKFHLSTSIGVGEEGEEEFTLVGGPQGWPISCAARGSSGLKMGQKTSGNEFAVGPRFGGKDAGSSPHCVTKPA